MTRKLKTLGVALVAVFALTAVMASAASAASFTSSSYPTTATGESAIGNDVFTTEGGAVECKSHFGGTLTEASSEHTVIPTYTNCKAFGFVEASMTGCKFKLTFAFISASLDIVNPCTIVASTCHVTLPNQGPLGSFAVNNIYPVHITLKANVSQIHYTVVKDGFLCPFNGTGTKTGATYQQGVAFTYNSRNGASISVS
jgi:hypothetical protein